MRRFSIRDILNRLKWAGGGLEGVEVEYISRGEPGGRGVIRGEDILGISCSMIELREKAIPYHRVTRIRKGDELLFQRD